MIEVLDVSHWFVTTDGPSLALRNVSFSVPRGQFVCLVGPSGCGKTTLLNVISGQVSPEQGGVAIGNKRDSSLKSPRIGYMFARDSLIPWRTVLDNVAFGLELAGAPRKLRRSRAGSMLELVGLGGKGNLLPHQLSHGMRQRANLARTLAVEPELLLVDEPFGALDAQTKAKLQSEFLRIWEHSRTTVVFVTHDLSEACLLADRILMMKNGALVADQPVDFARPRDLDKLRFEPEFQAAVRSQWDLISEESP